MTKRETYVFIKEAMADNEEIVLFCDKEIEALDKKAAKAKEKAAEKKAEGDALADVVYSVLTDEFAIIADITEKVRELDADATLHKVTYRLSALAKEGKIVKSKVTVESADTGKKREVVAYKIAD